MTENSNANDTTVTSLNTTNVEGTDNDMRQAIIADVLSAIRKEFSPLLHGQRRRPLPPSEDAQSVHADKYRFVDDEDNIPEDTSSEHDNDNNDENNLPRHSLENTIPGDNMSDLFTPNKHGGKSYRDLDVAEDILLQVDNEMPQSLDLGEKIKENVATRVTAHFLEKCLIPEVKKKVGKRHLLPENCTKMAVPKMNKCIFNLKSFSEFQTRNERNLYNTQQTLLSATSAIIEVVEKILQSDEGKKPLNSKDVVMNCLDAITLLGSVNTDLNNKRKQNVRTSLNPQYRDLCNPSRPCNEFLLGDDLQKGMSTYSYNNSRK